MSKNNPIGFVDSGVGGLTVVKAAQDQLPHEQFIFIGDTARMPYGPRPVQEVIDYTFQMAQFLLTAKHIKLLVIACNTATARALPQLQAQLPIPVIGVIVPGATAAAATTSNQKIGVIATQGTVTSGAYQDEIQAVNADVTIFQQAEPDFVQLVEANLAQAATTKDIVAQHLAPLTAQGIDTLVLGCTHFPLLAEAITAAVEPNVKLVDPGRETVRVIIDTLDQQALHTAVPHQHADDIFYTTKEPATFKAIATDWLARDTALDVRHLAIVGEGATQHLEEK
ncbi:glutamate racemase [Leuconostoc lactis]|uniref:glutamate racemase n=1 Tax=Leuconostoc lactis TaxID=1246 RepID=UPI0002195399|nr:glutamate racemase [Leuconostoc lactis]GHC23148.1 glutamate racemase [Leuconostoc lactis KCTC 3528 = DSM 20202]